MIKIKSIPDPIINNDFKYVYSPSDDTFLLIDYFKQNINQQYFDGKDILEIKNVLDLGTGTGIIALLFQTIKNYYPDFNPEIFATDILKEAINCAKLNAEANNFKNKIKFIQSDLFKAFPDNLKKSFDIIIFNPPYLPSLKSINESLNKTKIDNSWDGGVKGIEILINFLSKVKEFTKKDSYIYYISSSKSDLMQLNGYLEKIELINEILEKKHIFFEDIILNRIKINLG